MTFQSLPLTARTLVATPSMRRLLESRGFANLTTWSRGVDSRLFQPGDKQFLQLPRPVWLYLGRVAVEKGIEDFLRLDLPGSKLVVGDGPARAELAATFPEANFVGFKHGEDLARHIAAILENPGAAETMARDALGEGKPDATIRLAALVEDLAKEPAKDPAGGAA